MYLRIKCSANCNYPFGLGIYRINQNSHTVIGRMGLWGAKAVSKTSGSIYQSIHSYLHHHDTQICCCCYSLLLLSPRNSPITKISILIFPVAFVFFSYVFTFFSVHLIHFSSTGQDRDNISPNIKRDPSSSWHNIHLLCICRYWCTCETFVFTLRYDKMLMMGGCGGLVWGTVTVHEIICVYNSKMFTS